MRIAPVIVAAVLVTVVAGCSSDTDPSPIEPASPPATEEPPADAEPEVEESDPEARPPGRDELAEVWTAFHSAWVEQAAAENPDPAAFEGLVTNPDGTVELLETLRGTSRLVTTDQELWPDFSIDEGRAEIVDCAIVAQHPADQPDSIATVTVSWDATATVTDDGWRIDTAQPGELFCVAEDLNRQLVAAYTAWHDGLQEWYQPPDPEHSLLPVTMAEPGLADMRAMLAEDREAGISLRFPHQPQAVVTDVGMRSARITDCYEAPEGYGAFDVASGERQPDVVPAPGPEQLNRTIADINQTANGWLVVGWRWEERNSCEPGETRYAPR